MEKKERYVIITPVRDEEEYIEQTIKSVVHQTIKPMEWIIVNDGSKDRTGEIIDEYASRYSWIKTLHRNNRGCRDSAGGEIEAFYDGYKNLSNNYWNFIVKLDGDLSFDNDYFERCFKYFRRNPNLGIGGGMIYNLVKYDYIIEKMPSFHVRGATKIYRKECWTKIEKLETFPGWDTLDEVKANMMGWETSTFPNIKIIHHRFTGAAVGQWRNAIKNGLANYISGYHPLFMTFKCIIRIFRYPYIIGSLGLAYGFLNGYFKGVPLVDDIELIKYLRNQQLRRLLLRSSIWK